ncbi:multidrug effflux MFS transporter [Motilimonas cestriensis]|uniref:Bcr/CflA family efflux transporter n=1 Tax=Motilimonas cestriensis TaxID=2742685 RepID=A0ABS8W7P1_9GAMM|nr:multidrug effflux MFS transporter [Motilimonas cestriensis]MCE2594505.1 multidrug effflux MFS transporter [Motilimonas cestriensis]
MSRKLLPILMSMVVLSPLAIDIYLPSMPEMAAEFSVSDTQIQSTLVLFILSMGIGQILIGPLADRFGRKPIALFGISLYILSSLLAVYVSDFQFLQLARVLQGIAACATSIVVFSAVRDSFSNQQSAQYYSYLNGVICVIPALAPTLGGLLALQFGWRSTFMFMMAYAIMVLVVVAFKLPETRPTNTITNGPLYRWSRYQPVLANSHFVFYALTCMFAMAAILTYVSYAPSWVIKHLGVSEMTFSTLFGINALINIAACFTAPKVIKKLGNRSTVVLALWLIVDSAIAQVVTQILPSSSGLLSAIYFMTPMLLLCIGFALLLGPATSMALSGFGERAGTATAMLGCMQMSGAALLTGLVQLTDLSAPYANVLMLGGGAITLLLTMAIPRLGHWHHERLEVA